MTAKEYLNQAYYLDRDAALIIAKADKLRESLYGRAVQLDSAAVSGGGAHDIIGETVTKVVAYESEKDKKISELIAKRLEIESVIADVPDALQREVLERRYLLYQPWETYFDKRTGEKIVGIDEAMNYSARQIYRIHGEALQAVSQNVSECQLKK